MDFAEDRLVTGRKFFALLVKDEATAFALEVAVAPSFKGRDVEARLDSLVDEYGAPEYIRCDNGGRFIAFVVQKWAERRGIKMAHIDPGKPWRNGSAESFVGIYRKEALNAKIIRPTSRLETPARHSRSFCQAEKIPLQPVEPASLPAKSCRRRNAEHL